MSPVLDVWGFGPLLLCKEGERTKRFDPKGILNQAVAPKKADLNTPIPIYYCHCWPGQPLSHQSRHGSCHLRIHSLLRTEVLKSLNYYICGLGEGSQN